MIRIEQSQLPGPVLLLLLLFAAAACEAPAATATPTSIESAETSTVEGPQDDPAPQDGDVSEQPLADAPGTEVEVEILTFQFSQESLTISPGDTVTWNNQDEILHTVTSGSREYGTLGVVTDTQLTGLFDFDLDGRVPDQASASFQFDEPGSYPLICTIHPGIDMTVEVQA